MRWCRKTFGIIAYGQAVWSCPANAGDNPRGQEPGGTVAKSWFTGEITEQPFNHRAGSADRSVLPVVTLLVGRLPFSAHEAAGAVQHPAFPAPSYF